MPSHAGWSCQGYVLEAARWVFLCSKGFRPRNRLLVDDRWSRVGTSNLDHRSMRLDVETSLLVERRVLGGELEPALQRDFEAPEEVTYPRLA